MINVCFLEKKISENDNKLMCFSFTAAGKLAFSNKNSRIFLISEILVESFLFYYYLY